MNWPLAAPEMVAALTLVAVAVTMASVVAARRRRRLHRRMIKEALGVMCAHLSTGATPVVREQRGLAETLDGQHRLAQRVGEEIAPYVLRGGPAKPGTLEPPGAGPAERIAGAIHELRVMAQQRGVPERPPVHRSSTGPVPALDGSEDLAELVDAMLVTAAGRIRQANTILRIAASIGAADQDTRDRLSGALRDAEAGRRQGEKFAEHGQLVSAVHTITHIEVPVPDRGVPGEATRRDVERHASQLRRIAAGHEAELLGWLIDAAARYAYETGGTAA
jgi:hypothetical protein